MASYIVNGYALPEPDNRERPAQTFITRLTGGENSNGVFIGQKIGRTLTDITLMWDALPTSEWSNIIQIFNDNPISHVTYFDMGVGEVITRPMRVEGISAQSLEYDTNTGAVITCFNCRLTLKDTGG